MSIIKRGGIYKDNLSSNIIIVIEHDKVNNLFICVQIDRFFKFQNLPESKLCRKVDRVFYEYETSEEIAFDIDKAPADSFIMETSDGKRWIEKRNKFDVLERQEKDLKPFEVSLFTSLFIRLVSHLSPLPHYFNTALYIQKRLKSKELAKSKARGKELARNNKALAEAIKTSDKGFNNLLKEFTELSKGNYEDLKNYCGKAY